MAQGDGEVLATFAGLMGVADADRAEFYAFTQQNFARIFASERGDRARRARVAASS